jgi:hypothetical protein
VAGRLKDLEDKEAAVVTAALLMREKQLTQAMLVVKYLYEEWKQFRYFSLTDLAPPNVPENPQSSDILLIQQSLESKYENEIKRQQQRTLMWVYIVINATTENSTISAMRSDASTSVILPIPLKSVNDSQTNTTRLVANTNYYGMRLHNVNVYLLDADGAALGNGPVQVELTKSGHSSFFSCSSSPCASTDDMQLHTFTHDEIKYGRYVYDSKTGCAVTSSYCGDLCPDYIRYSPFGQWTIQVPSPSEQGVDLSKIAALRFEFQVDTQTAEGFNPNIFGKPPDKYPQNVCTSSTCCPHNTKEDMEPIVSLL